MKIGKENKDGKQFKSKEAERRYQAYKHMHPCKEESPEERKSRLAVEAIKEEEPRQAYREHQRKQTEMIRRRESSGERY